MSDLRAVRQAVDQLLGGNLEPLLDLLSKDVVFQVSPGEVAPLMFVEGGKQAVSDYFTAQGGLVAFWQLDYAFRGPQLIAWGKESFTIEGSDLEGGCDFALVFDLEDGLISRILVVEDLRAFLRGGNAVLEHTLGEEEPSHSDPDEREWDWHESGEFAVVS